MEQLRSSRINKELRLKRIARAREISSMLTEYRAASEYPPQLPSIGDIYTLPGVQNTVLDGTDEEFAALKSDIVSRLPQLTIQCFEERRTTLMELLPEKLRTRDGLFLAPTSFSCNLCQAHGMGARETIYHSCGCYSWGPDPQMNLYGKEIPWSKALEQILYYCPAVELKRDIVLAVGEDPATITDAGMDLGNHRFLTYPQSGTLSVLSWRGLVSDADLLRCYD